MLIRRNRAFRRLWAAGAVSLVGDWLSFVAVAALALSSGGGAFGLALVFAAPGAAAPVRTGCSRMPRSSATHPTR